MAVHTILAKHGSYWFNGPDSLSSDSAVQVTAATGPATSLGSYFIVGQSSTGQHCWEGFLEFDTSAIPGTPSSAVLTLNGKTDNDTVAGGWNIEARLRDWGGAPIDFSDWVAYTDLAALTLLGTYNTLGFSNVAVCSFSDIAMLANLNLSGVTRMLLNSARMRTLTTWVSLEIIEFFSQDSDMSKWPRLLITTTLDAAPANLLYPACDIFVNKWFDQVPPFIIVATSPFSAGDTPIAANLYSRIDEAAADDSNYISSKHKPTSAEWFEALLAPHTDPALSTGHILHVRSRAFGPGSVNVKTDLYQGTTLIATFTSSAISSSWTERTYTLSGGEADSISDYSDLRLRFSGASAADTLATKTDRGSTTNLTSQSSTVVTITGDTEVGSLMIARVAADNAGSGGAAAGLTVSDSKGNFWNVGLTANQDPGSVSAGQTCYLATAWVKTALLTNDTVTFTWGTPVTAKAIVVEEWKGIWLSSGGPTTAVGGSATPSIAQSGGADILVYCALAVEGGTADVYTEDTDTSNGSWVSLTRVGSGSGTSGSTIAGAYKLCTASGTQTWNPAITNRDWAACLVLGSIGTQVQVSQAYLELPEVVTYQLNAGAQVGGSFPTAGAVAYGAGDA